VIDMAKQQITFNDANDIVVSVNLENQKYRLRFVWNHIADFWVMHLYNYQGKPLLENLKLVPNFPVMFNHHNDKAGIPKGEFFVITKEEQLTRNSFKEGTATLIYVTGDEMYGTV